MDPHRRDVLALIAALAAAGLLPGCGRDPAESDAPPEPAPDRPPEPAPWAAPGAHDPDAFAWTPVVADATSDAALVALHTTEAVVDLVVVGATADGWEEVDRRTLDVTDGWVTAELTGLVPDRAHRLAFLAGERRSEVVRFRTALASSGYRKVVVGATSCLGSANPDLDSLARLAEREPDVVLLLGDTVYADGSRTIDDYRRHWSRVLGKASFRALCQSASVAATWDDHEVDDNWELGRTVSEDQLSAAIAAFRGAIPWRQGGGEIGLWRSLRWGDVLEVFLLDSRGERDWDARIVSEEQLEWATSAIRASTATFKIVCCSVHLADHTQMFGTIEETDRWQGYPAQRDQLVAACAEVPGVIVLTGDMHYGGLQRLAPPGGLGEGVFEVAAGPGGSNLLPASEIAEIGEEDHTIQYPILVDTWTAAVLTFDPGLGTVAIEFVDDEGTVVAEQTLTLT